MLEWNAPAAIVCATNLREMGAYEMAPILRADPKTAIIPLIALGTGGDQACSKPIARAATITWIAGAARGHRRAHAQLSAQPPGRLPAHADAFERGDTLSAAAFRISIFPA